MNGKIRVLIVDDEELFARNLARVLGFRGLETATAFDGHQALEAVQRDGPFDVVVLDVKMPVMDGIAALEAIKAEAPATEVIMLTGHATVETGVRAIRHGAYDYLMKPCDFDELVAKITEASEVEAIKRQPILWPRNLVREIHTGDFEQVPPHTPLSQVIDRLRREEGDRSVDEIYVVGAAGELLGVVTRRCLIDACNAAVPGAVSRWTDLLEAPSRLPDRSVDEIMAPPGPTTRPEETLTAVAQRMISNRVRCAPVIDEGRMIGLIRLQDVFHYVEHAIE